MTAHRPKPTLTPERIAWFAEYYTENPGWGVFHVTLVDGNWKLGAYLGYWPEEKSAHPADVLEAAAWFDTITPSQRRKLKNKAENSTPQPPATATDSPAAQTPPEPHPT